MGSEKIRKFLKNSVGYILATLFTFAYVGLSILEVSKTGKNALEIIGAGFIFYVFQIVLITLFRSQGLTNGKNHATYKATVELHGEKVEGISGDMDCLPSWCEQKNKKNYERQRKKILGRAALKYGDYFDDNGDVKTFYVVNTDNLKMGWKNRFNRRKERRRIKAYHDAVNLKLSPLDDVALTSADKSKEDIYALPDSEKEFMGRNSIKDIVVKVFPAVLFGYYGVSQLPNFSWATFAWTAFQALMAYVSAIAQMFSARDYVINDVRTGIVKKISWLDEFSADIKRNPDKYKEASKIQDGKSDEYNNEKEHSAVS